MTVGASTFSSSKMYDYEAHIRVLTDRERIFCLSLSKGVGFCGEVEAWG
jgi:hypothetical protein